MKKLLLTALLFAGLATTGFSQERDQQEKKTPEERAQMMTDGLAKKLSLTADQKTAVYKINLDRANQMEKIHNLPKEERKNQMAKMKEMGEASESKIIALLNSDQKKTFEEMQAKRKEQAKKHMGETRKKPQGKPEAEAGE